MCQCLQISQPVADLLCICRPENSELGDDVVAALSALHRIFGRLIRQGRMHTKAKLKSESNEAVQVVRDWLKARYSEYVTEVLIPLVSASEVSLQVSTFRFSSFITMVMTYVTDAGYSYFNGPTTNRIRSINLPKRSPILPLPLDLVAHHYSCSSHSAFWPSVIIGDASGVFRTIFELF